MITNHLLTFFELKVRSVMTYHCMNVNRLKVKTMFKCSVKDNRVFEVKLYNKHVRALLKENKSHDFYSDYWGDVRNHAILASDESAALNIINIKFPQSKGFVVQEFSESILD